MPAVGKREALFLRTFELDLKPLDLKVEVMGGVAERHSISF